MQLADVLNQNADFDWFVQGRFGMFIHWGTYSLAARHEWVRGREEIPWKDYRKYFEHFRADRFDPELWAAFAKQAGMTYAVLTTKHHEGFCLFDSKHTDYKAPNTPAGRDLLKEWVEAFRAEGLKIGFYHSLIDWHHPEYPTDLFHPGRNDEAYKAKDSQRDIRKYAAYLHAQVEELLTNYGTVDYLWFDFSYPQRPGGKGRDDWQSDKLVEMIHRLQPNILLNNRLDIPEGGVRTPEQYQPRDTGVREEPKFLTEECHTMNESWGYDRDNKHWKSTEMMIQMLVKAVARGANFLLNVGPDGRGALCPDTMERLEGIGEWMELHGEAIHGAGQADFAAPEGCRFTQKGKRLFLHVFTWPYKEIPLDELGDRITYAQFLHDGSEIAIVPAKQGHHGPDGEGAADSKAVKLKLPTLKPAVTVPVIELTLA